MAEAYLIDAVRTPVGKRGGGLSRVHPADLGAHVLRALVARTGIDPVAVEDVVFGCCDTVGPQAGDIARTCWLAAGLPQHVRPEVGRVHAGEPAAALPDRGADRIDEIGLCHAGSPS